MREEEFDEDVVEATRAVAHSSVKRLSDLTTGPLELALIDEQEHNFAPTDLSTVLDDVREMPALPIDECGAEFRVEPMPSTVTDEPLLPRLFLNLIANAMKSRHPERPPRVEISAVSDPSGSPEIAVADNGLGIEPRFAQRIFQPMQRLHSRDEIEGAGLGPTICERAVAAHAGSIRLDADYRDGARFVVTRPSRSAWRAA